MKILSFTNEMYKAIINDIDASPQYEKSVLSRMTTTSYGIQFVFAVSQTDYRRSLCLRVIDDVNISALPRWNGINIDLLKIPEYSPSFYIRLEQRDGSDSNIFEIVVDDIILSLQNAKDDKMAYMELMQALTKWKLFFDFSSEINMSPLKQQGLYGELLYLKEAIKKNGAAAVYSWTGPDAETHDFYFGANAVEIKTTSSKAPYNVIISSEYQLDNNDITGDLFLIFFALHKSKATGETLPEIISELKTSLSADISALQDFQLKLVKYGYIENHIELYPYGYTLRERQQFWIKDDFPRITRQLIPSGIGSVTYSLSLSNCSNYMIKQSTIDKATQR